MDSTPQNMTSGNSFRQIVLFFLPLMSGNLLQQLYSLVDAVIVGKGISDQALAAVGASGTLNFLVLGFVIGLTRGYGILFSQSYGAGDLPRLRGYIQVSRRLCIIVSLAFSLVCIAGLKHMFLFLRTPEDIYEDAYRYFVIILAGILITALNNLALTLLQSLGDSKTPLRAMIFSSLANILLDLLLVLGLHMGVAGAAWATIAAQLLSLLYSTRQIRKIDLSHLSEEDGIIRDPVRSTDPSPDLSGKTVTSELLRMALPVAFMNSITAMGGVILQYFVNGMGSDYVAAYSACMKLAGVFEGFGVSVGLSMLTFVGQNTGAQKYSRIRKGVRQGIFLSTAVNLPFVLMQVFFPGLLGRMLLSDPVIIHYFSEFLPILGICLFPLGWLFVYRFSVQGLGNTFIPMLSGILEVALRLIFGFTLGRKSFRGIAYSEVSAWIGAFIMLMITYYVLMYLHSRKQPSDIV
jgi:putative MATE family efflux protein